MPSRLNVRSGRAVRLHVVFFLSGVAGLGYQMAWAKMFAAGLGHELPATLAVVAAFMGGMALGSAMLDRTLSRSAQPGRWYAGLELLIGFWGFASTEVIPLVNHIALPAIGLEPSAGRQWLVAFGLPWLALLPATVAMGATLPAMERFVAPQTADRRCVAALYAANTAGAMTGTLVSVFVLFPAIGLRETVWVFAMVNALCGIVVWVMGMPPACDPPRQAGHRSPTAPALTSAERRAGDCATLPTSPLVGRRSPTAPSEPDSRWRLNLAVFVTGLLGIGYETLGVRVLSQVLENTIYTFAVVLAIYLLGLALGAAGFQRWGRSRSWQPWLSNLLIGLATAGLLGILALGQAQSFYDGCRARLGESIAGVALAEMLVAATVFALPAILSGAVFSQLAQASRRADGGVGEALGYNTLGGAVAPLLFGVLLLPAIGSKWTLTWVSLGYLALLPVAGILGKAPAPAGQQSGRRRGFAFVLLPIALLALLPSNLALVQLGPGEKLVEFRDGVMASVAVVQDATGNVSLRVNNRFQMGGTGATDAERRHAHIPLLLHPRPRRALFLGLGTGITFGTATEYPGLRADGVELLPEVVEVMHRFEPDNCSPEHQSTLNVFVADARRYVRTTSSTYDVIVADLFQPARDGAGALYTIEHFRAIRARLAPGGLFCQWLPLHQLDEPMLRVIVRTFREVFPNVHACLLRFNVDAPVLGLVGTLDAPSYSPTWVERRLDSPALTAQLKQLALADSIRLFGCLVAGPRALGEFAGDAPLNTDDHPVVACRAPRFVYQRQALPYGRLLPLLARGDRDLADLIPLEPGSADRAGFLARLQAFMAARDIYLNGLVAETEGRTAAAIDAFVESAHRSVDFTLGYAQCLDLAVVEAKSNPAAARALLERLVAAQPSQPVARELLRRMFGP